MPSGIDKCAPNQARACAGRRTWVADVSFLYRSSSFPISRISFYVYRCIYIYICEYYDGRETKHPLLFSLPYVHILVLLSGNFMKHSRREVSLARLPSIESFRGAFRTREITWRRRIPLLGILSVARNERTSRSKVAAFSG